MSRDKHRTYRSENQAMASNVACFGAVPAMALARAPMDSGHATWTGPARVYGAVRPEVVDGALAGEALCGDCGHDRAVAAIWVTLAAEECDRLLGDARTVNGRRKSTDKDPNVTTEAGFHCCA